MIFAVVVTFVHCYYGYNAGGGPAGVGVAAGRAIRLSIILVVVVNLILSLVLFGGVNVTARLVG
jgi:phospholipid/cholesterol/gamma-HCH transport system permease protein